MTSSSLDNERRPLLSQSPLHEEEGEEEGSQSRVQSWLRSKIASWKAALSQKDVPVVLCLFLLQFLVSFAKHVIEVPMVRLLEMAICNKYYRTHDIPNVPFVATQEIAEKLCKVAPVQDTLSTITGWRFSFDAIPGTNLVSSTSQPNYFILDSN